MPIYMKIEGVKGDVTAAGYEGAFEVMSFSWGASNPVTIGGGGTGAGRVSISSFNILKSSGQGTTKLMLACCQGKHFPKAEVVITRSGAREVVFQKLKFDPIYVESIQWSGDGGSIPTESASFAFERVEMTQYTQAPNGQITASETMHWDLRSNSGGGS